MKKNMIFKSSIIILFIAILILTAQNVSAHPPSKINIKYDTQKNELSVNITHSVTANDHFIESIEIKINGEIYDIYDYISQPNRISFTYKYDINSNDGDKITVRAICSQFGTLTRELTVGEEGDSSSTPGFIILSILASIFLVALIRRNKNI